jgi:hypothetical protein
MAVSCENRQWGKNSQLLGFFGGGGGEGPPSRCYGRTAALRFIVQLLWWRRRERLLVFSIFPSNGAPVEWNWQGKTEVLGEKPVPVPLCPPLIPHRLTRDWTRASAVGGRQLTAWAMARPVTAVTFTASFLWRIIVVTIIGLSQDLWLIIRQFIILKVHKLGRYRHQSNGAQILWWLTA